MLTFAEYLRTRGEPFTSARDAPDLTCVSCTEKIKKGGPNLDGRLSMCPKCSKPVHNKHGCFQDRDGNKNYVCTKCFGSAHTQVSVPRRRSISRANVDPRQPWDLPPCRF